MKKKIILPVLTILGISLILVGTSYAYWRFTYISDKTNIGKSKCLSIELINQKNEISLNNTYPISDIEAKKLTPYSFTINNTCDTFISYDVNLEMLEGTTMNSKYMAVMINNEHKELLSNLDNANTIMSSSVESRKLVSGSLGVGDSVDYTLRLWIDESVTLSDDAMNKNFTSKIVVTAQPSNYSPKDAGYDTLHDAILANEYQTTPEKAIEKINAKGEPDFSAIAPSTVYEEKISSVLIEYTVLKPHPSIIGKSEYGTEKLSSLDSFPRVGTSYSFDEKNGIYNLLNTVKTDVTELDFENNDYYLCGSGTNSTNANISVFDDQSCSNMRKIVSATKTTIGEPNTNTYRVEYIMNVYEYSQNAIESDFSDRGLYSTNDANGTTYYYRGNISNNNVYFAGFYWQIVRINGDGSVKLIYNGDIKNAKGKDKDGNYKNEVDSNIKSIIDLWYEKNILNNNFSRYVYDTGYCNDRSIYSGDGVTVTTFSPFTRSTNYKPDLICTLSNDLFSTVESTFGNKALKYPIALLTVDELMLAGLVKDKVNYLNYLYSGAIAWTMSPTYISAWKSANIAMIYINGSIHDTDYTDDYNWGVQNPFSIRPVISLKSNVKISSGIGTVNEPFVIDTNN